MGQITEVAPFSKREAKSHSQATLSADYMASFFSDACMKIDGIYKSSLLTFIGGRVEIFVRTESRSSFLHKMICQVFLFLCPGTV